MQASFNLVSIISLLALIPSIIAAPHYYPIPTGVYPTGIYPTGFLPTGTGAWPSPTGYSSALPLKEKRHFPWHWPHYNTTTPSYPTATGTSVPSYTSSLPTGYPTASGTDGYVWPTPTGGWSWPVLPLN